MEAVVRHTGGPARGGIWEVGVKPEWMDEPVNAAGPFKSKAECSAANQLMLRPSMQCIMTSRPFAQISAPPKATRCARTPFH